MPRPADKLILYMTDACHLCEQAQQIIRAALGGRVTEIDMIDIAADEDLLERYGVRIPVLRRTDTKTELDWPFFVADVVRFALSDKQDSETSSETCRSASE